MSNAIDAYVHVPNHLLTVNNSTLHTPGHANRVYFISLKENHGDKYRAWTIS